MIKVCSYRPSIIILKFNRHRHPLSIKHPRISILNLEWFHKCPGQVNYTYRFCNRGKHTVPTHRYDLWRTGSCFFKSNHGKCKQADGTDKVLSGTGRGVFFYLSATLTTTFRFGCRKFATVPKQRLAAPMQFFWKIIWSSFRTITPLFWTEMSKIYFFAEMIWN